MQQLSLFRGVHDTQPHPVTLEEVVTMMRTDQSVRDLTEKYRYARSTGDERNAGHYKKMMPNFGVAARFEGGRQQKHIVELTGMSLVDIDHVAPDQMAAVLEKVRADEHTLLAYTTISGEGVRVLARYVFNDNETPLTCSDTTINLAKPTHRTTGTLTSGIYKTAFLQVNNYYEELIGITTDGQCKKITRISTIAYDKQLYYNPDATPFVIKMEEKKPVGRPKGVKSEKERVRSCKVGDVEPLVLRELEHRGVLYEPGSHNKYISDACYMMNRYGVPLDDCTAWALERFADYAQTDDVPAIVRSCYQQTDEHGTVKPRRGTKAESLMGSVSDIRDYLASHDVQSRYNVITRKYEIYNEELDTWCEKTDRMENTLYCRITEEIGKRILKSDLHQLLGSEFSPEYNPFADYLTSLPPIPDDDDTDYIDLVASMVHVDATDDAKHRRWFKKWFVAMIACWLDPEVTNHVILAYIGRQGIYKSTFMRRLLPPVLSSYFAVRNYASRMDKDDRLMLTEKGLVALEEIDSLTPRELNQLKAIVTAETIDERDAYSANRESRTHIASFCATGNNRRFLTDLTGNRRWRPFYVNDIDSPYTHSIPHDSLYAQAHRLYREGFRYWFEADEVAELDAHNANFEEPCMEEELILTYLRRPVGEETGEFLTATRIMELIGMYVHSHLSAKKVALCMNRLGFEQRRTHTARGWIVVTLTGDDIKAAQRMNAHRSSKDE